MRAAASIPPCASSQRPGARDDPVGYCVVRGGAQLFNAGDLESGRSDPVDVRAHRNQHLAEVDDFRLASYLMYPKVFLDYVKTQDK